MHSHFCWKVLYLVQAWHAASLLRMQVSTQVVCSTKEACACACMHIVLVQSLVARVAGCMCPQVSLHQTEAISREGTNQQGFTADKVSDQYCVGVRGCEASHRPC